MTYHIAGKIKIDNLAQNHHCKSVPMLLFAMADAVAMPADLTLAA
jgi:hypothetical protein